MRLYITLLLLCIPTAAATPQGRIVTSFPYVQSFSFVPTGTSAAPAGPVGTRAFARDTSDGGEFTVDAATSSSWVNATTTGLNNNAGAGGAIRIQTSGSTSPTNAQGFLLNLDLTGRIAGTVSVNWSKVQNGTSTRRNELRVAASVDGGAFTDLATASFDNSTSAQSGTLNVDLPSSLDGMDEVRLWLYSINVSGTGAHPRVVVDSLIVEAPSDNALPVELALFSVAWAGDAPLLSWRTASETSNAGFEVLRGPNDTSLVPVASYTTTPELRGLGTSPLGREYSFADVLPESVRESGGPVRYRLVSVGLDGERHSSATRTLRIPGAGTGDSSALTILSITGVAPHPVDATALVTMRFPAPTSGRLEVLDARGCVRERWLLGHTAPGERRHAVDLDALPPGVYALRLATPIGVRTKLITVR